METEKSLEDWIIDRAVGPQYIVAERHQQSKRNIEYPIKISNKK